jgi:hypothetical protein
MGPVTTSDDLEPRRSEASARSPASGTAEGNQAEIESLRQQLREKDKLIAVYQQRLGSPVFLIKAAVWNVIHLLPYIFRKLRDRQLVRRRARREIDIIRRSGLFEEAWYLTQNPDVAARGEDPVAHYVRRGAAGNLDPSRSFSTRSYLLIRTLPPRAPTRWCTISCTARPRGAAAKATIIRRGSSVSTH